MSATILNHWNVSNQLEFSAFSPCIEMYMLPLESGSFNLKLTTIFANVNCNPELKLQIASRCCTSAVHRVVINVALDRDSNVICNDSSCLMVHLRATCKSNRLITNRLEKTSTQFTCTHLAQWNKMLHIYYLLAVANIQWTRSTHIFNW